MTLQTISHRVLDVTTWVKRQFGDESGVQIDDADIIRWLNQGQDEIAQTAKVIQAISTSTLVAGTFDYAFPVEDAIDIIMLRVDGSPVQSWEFQTAEHWLTMNDPKRASTGVPQFWWQFGGRLYFYPTPDIPYPVTVFYTKAPATLTTTTDLLGLPDKYFEALVQYVLSKAYELDEDSDSAKQARQNYFDRLGQQYEEDTYSGTQFYPKLSFIED